MLRYLSLLILIFSLALKTSQSCAAIEITDSHGKYRFEEPPKRIVSLNWALTENLLELGEVPLGVADLKSFKALGVVYKVPESVEDLGPRLSPNLAKIKSLKPDIILIGYSQRSLIRPLSNIATVIYFRNFSKRYVNADKADERFKEMAKLFQKEALADKLIAKRETRLVELSRQLEQVHDKLPSLVLMAPFKEGERYLTLFGQNSLPAYAAKRLGLEVLEPEQTDGFGVGRLSEQEFAELSEQADNIDLYRIEIGEQEPSFSSQPPTPSSLMGCALEIDYMQAFGGAMSILHLANSIARAINGLDGEFCRS